MSKIEYKQTSYDYAETIVKELRLRGLNDARVDGDIINVSLLGVEIIYRYAHYPNLMADVYRCLSHLGIKLHNHHLENKLLSIKQ